MKYYYSVIRFVPNVISGDYVTIGMLVGAVNEETNQEGDDITHEIWTLRLPKKHKRARAIDYKKTFDIVLEEIDREKENYTLDHLTWLSKSARSIIQYSQPYPCISQSVDEVFDILWDSFIV